MKVIVTPAEYGKIIGNTQQAVYSKIAKGKFPLQPLVYKPFMRRNKIVQRPFINLTYLRDNDEQFLKFIDDDLLKLIEEKRWKEIPKWQNGIKIPDFADYLDSTSLKILKDVDNGIYPYVLLPGKKSKKRSIRILKRETIEKYPDLDKILN